jgi:hypothetical protein
MTLLVRQIPAWVKQKAFERGAMPALARGDGVELSLAPLAGGAPTSRRFSAAEYESDRDRCWQQVLAAFTVSRS